MFGLEQKALLDRIARRLGSDCGVEEDQGLGGESLVKVGRHQTKEGGVHYGKVFYVWAKACHGYFCV